MPSFTLCLIEYVLIQMNLLRFRNERKKNDAEDCEARIIEIYLKKCFFVPLFQSPPEDHK